MFTVLYLYVEKKKSRRKRFMEVLPWPVILWAVYN